MSNDVVSLIHVAESLAADVAATQNTTAYPVLAVSLFGMQVSLTPFVPTPVPPPAQTPIYWFFQPRNSFYITTTAF